MPARFYSGEFKREAVAQVTEQGRKVTDVARRLGVSRAVLYRWIKQSESGTLESVPLDAVPENELARLRREVAELREENSFLKKAAAYFAKRPRGTR
jgi:transposase